jgi:hypothetical protein
MVRSSSIFLKASIALLWFAAVIDPVGAFGGIRYVALALLFLFISYLFISGLVFRLKLDLQAAFVCVFAIFLPVWGLYVYSARGVREPFADTSYIVAGVLALSVFYYRSQSLTEFGIQAFIVCVRALSLITIFCFFSVYFDLSSVPWIFPAGGAAYFGEREYGSIQVPYIYFVASPLLIMLLAYDFSKLESDFGFVSLLLFSSTFFALFLSGTRAHMLISLTIFIWYPLLFRFQRGYGSYLTLGVCLSLFFVVIVFSSDVGGFVRAMFDVRESSNSQKISMLSGYQSILSDPITALFGQGFNAHSWSSTFQAMINRDIGATRTELTYLEIFRVFGLVGGGIFCLFLIYLLYRARRLPQDFRWAYPALVMLLLNAALNPYLFSTNGILPLTLLVAMIRFFSPVRVSM